MELASTYAPQNFYCYAIDANSSPMFHARMKSLVNCFHNVYLTTTEFVMDSKGKCYSDGTVSNYYIPRKQHQSIRI